MQQKPSKINSPFARRAFGPFKLIVDKALVAGILSLNLLLLACVGPGDVDNWIFGDQDVVQKGLDNSDPENKASQRFRKTVVYDGTNRRLGPLTNSALFIDSSQSSETLVIESDKGYFYRLNDQTGDLQDSAADFHATKFNNGKTGGRLFLKWPKEAFINGKEVHRNPADGELYTYADVFKGRAEVNTSILSYEAKINNGKFISVQGGTIEPSESAYELKKISKDAAGIPVIISAPLRFSDKVSGPSEAPGNSGQIASRQSSSTPASLAPSTTTQANLAPSTTTQANPAPSTTTQANLAPSTTTQANLAPSTTTQANPAPSTTTQANPAPSTTTQANLAPSTTTQASPAPDGFLKSQYPGLTADLIGKTEGNFFKIEVPPNQRGELTHVQQSLRTYNVGGQDYPILLTSGDFVYIPDAKFRSVLGTTDGWVNRAGVRDILLQNPNNIASVLGVQHFTDLDALNFEKNDSLSQIDLSPNTTLTNLNLASNQLIEIDLSANTALRFLKLGGNQLKSADIRGMQAAQDSLDLSINACSGGKNPLTKMLVHENIKNHAEIKEAKTNCGSNLTIKTYSGKGPADYALVDGDYTP